MTIDIMTALDQAYFQAEQASNKDVAATACQHYRTLTLLLQRQLLLAGMESVSVSGDGAGEALAPFQHGKLQAGPIDWTQELAARFNRMEPMQLTGEIPANYYKDQRDELLDVVNELRNYFERGEMRHRLDPRKVLECTLEHFRREGVSLKPSKLTQRAWVEHQAERHGKPVHWYKSSVRGLGDPGLQWTPTSAGEQPEPPAPDVINMKNPRNWQAGDVLKRKQFPKSPNFTAYREYTVAENDGRYVRITGNDGTPVSYPLDMIQSEPASDFFTWLRHGDTPAA